MQDITSRLKLRRVTELISNRNVTFKISYTLGGLGKEPRCSTGWWDDGDGGGRRRSEVDPGVEHWHSNCDEIRANMCYVVARNSFVKHRG